MASKLFVKVINTGMSTFSLLLGKNINVVPDFNLTILNNGFVDVNDWGTIGINEILGNEGWLDIINN